MSNAAQISVRSQGICPHCNLGAHFKVQLSRELWPEDERAGRPAVLLCFVRCQGCGLQSVVAETSSETVDEISYEIVMPAEEPRTLSEHVPPEVRSLFHEASIAEAAGALRAAGVMYRAAVEAMVKERKAEGKDLYAKINNLPLATGDLKTDLHEARVLGNTSIHDGLLYDRDEIEDVASLIEEACELIYVQPQQRATMRERRKARQVAAKEKKTAAAKPPAGDPTPAPTSITL